MMEETATRTVKRRSIVNDRLELNGWDLWDTNKVKCCEV